jgi:uroporphyrinogen III methyltransferase/synthase
MMPPVVVITRPREQASELSSLLRAAGFDPREQPTILIEPTWSAADAAPILARLRGGEYAWIIVPSRTAARGLIHGLRAAGATDADFATARLLSGPGTAETLRELGLDVDTVLPRFSAAAALAHLTQPLLGGEGVLIPRAAEGRDELIAGLRERGISVDAPVLYRTRAVPPVELAPLVGALRAGAITAVTFTSPSTVSGLANGLHALGEDALVLLGQLALVCIGETTASAVRAAGLPAPVVADRTSLVALVDAVRRALTVATVPEAAHP